MSQLRVSTIASTSGQVSVTNNALGANPTTAIALHATRTGYSGAINDGTLRALADLAHNFGTAYYISSWKTPTQNTRSFINWIKTVA